MNAFVKYVHKGNPEAFHILPQSCQDTTLTLCGLVATLVAFGF
jgi:hypothetical protein